jgi:hypothetical protein
MGFLSSWIQTYLKNLKKAEKIFVHFYDFFNCLLIYINDIAESVVTAKKWLISPKKVIIKAKTTRQDWQKFYSPAKQKLPGEPGTLMGFFYYGGNEVKKIFCSCRSMMLMLDLESNTILKELFLSRTNKIKISIQLRLWLAGSCLNAKELKHRRKKQF